MIMFASVQTFNQKQRHKDFEEILCLELILKVTSSLPTYHYILHDAQKLNVFLRNM
jgi:hypothetical protein